MYAKFALRQKNFINKKFFSTNNYDLAVIGGGPGGYIAAIKAGQKNLKVVCIEKRGTLGGTCLNVGCIPSKALLNTSQKYYEAKNSFNELGITADNLSYDMDKIMSHKTKIVGQLCGGIEGLFKKNKVDYLKGYGRFKDSETITVDMNDGTEQEIKAKHVIIATGSEPTNLPGGILPIDEKTVVSSTGALSLEKVPKKMIVVGAGVIGLELGSVYARLGCQVEVVEFAKKIMPPFDNEVCSSFQKMLVKQGFKFHLQNKVVGGSVASNGQVTLEVEDMKKNEKVSMSADIVLVSTGRKPFTDGLNLKAVGIETDKLGRIPVDKNLMSSV